MPLYLAHCHQVQASCDRLLLSSYECGSGEGADGGLEASEELPPDHEEARQQQKLDCGLALVAADPYWDLAAHGGEGDFSSRVMFNSQVTPHCRGKVAQLEKLKSEALDTVQHLLGLIDQVLQNILRHYSWIFAHSIFPRAIEHCQAMSFIPARWWTSLQAPRMGAFV